MSGGPWRRPADTLGLAAVVNAISRDRRQYLSAAERLTAEIEAGTARDAEASPAAEAARAYIQGELPMLRAIDHIVIREMAERLA